MAVSKPITLSRLIKELQKLEAKGLGRRKVSIAKETLWDGNGTFPICDVHDAVPIWVYEADGDGFRTFNKDGTERGGIRIVLRGQWADECPTPAEFEKQKRERLAASQGANS